MSELKNNKCPYKLFNPSKRNPAYAVGDKKGKLLILEIVDTGNPRCPIFICECDCGNIAKFKRSAFSISNGKQCYDCFQVHVKHARSIKPLRDRRLPIGIGEYE